MINLLGLGITLLLAIPLGIIAARKYQGWQDRSITLFNFIGFSIPGFWLSLLVVVGVPAVAYFMLDPSQRRRLRRVSRRE